MKFYLALSISIVFAFAKAETAPKPSQKATSSTIKKVTVYLNGAQVQRSASTTVFNGITTLKFNDLSPYIDENSIQISGLNQADLLSVNYEIDYINTHKNPLKIDSLRTAEERLIIQKRRLNATIAGLKKEEEIMNLNKKLGSTTLEITTQKLKELTNYYRKRLVEIRNLIIDNEIEQKSINDNLQAIRKQINALDINEALEKGVITLKLHAKTMRTLDLKITYTVSQSGWFPMYDLRAGTVNEPIDLVYKSHIYQKTGVHWDNVQLTLSTGDPTTNSTKPELDTKYLRFISANSYRPKVSKKANHYKFNPFVKRVKGTIYDDAGLPLPGANVIVKGTTNGTQTDFDGNFELAIEKGKMLQISYVGFTTHELPIHSSRINAYLEADNALEEIVVTAQGIKREKSTLGYASTIARDLQGKVAGIAIEPINKTATGQEVSEQLTSASFEISEKYSIPSEGDVTVIAIDAFKVPATFEYYAAPVLNENVFLTAKINNWERFNLLPGEANIYFEGRFSGKTQINPYATTAALTVSLGVDHNIIVKRKQLSNFKDKSFTGGSKIIDKGYEIVVKNNKNNSITLKLLDRIPISQNKAIKVQDINTPEAQYNAKTGLITWSLKLEAQKTQKHYFNYSIKYPKNNRINL